MANFPPKGPPKAQRPEEPVFQDPKDQVLFHQPAPIGQQAGIYSMQTSKAKHSAPMLPPTSSGILNSPKARMAYESYGLEGLKSVMLEQLLQLDWGPLQDELTYLADAANEHTEIKRGLRATKLMAAQRLEDPRLNDEDWQKCDFIFRSINPFGKIEIQPLEGVGGQMQAMEIAFPTLAEPVGAEEEHELAPGSAVLLMTDIQGHYDKLQSFLSNLQLAVERDGQLHWAGPQEFYLVILGDLFNKSPFSSWGDSVGQDSYRVVKTLQRMAKVAGKRILLSLGAYDLDLALGAAFYHPTSGFLGAELGVNAQAQAIPAILSFLRGTSVPGQPDFAWDLHGEQGESYVLKESYQQQGFPLLTVPAAESGPDISALTDFYEALLQRMIHPQLDQRPRSIQDLDAIAAGLIPATSEILNLQNLASSLGRCLHYYGLLAGSGILDFLRAQIAGLHVLKAGELEIFAMHPEIQEITLDMLGEIKKRGLEGWQIPEIEPFLQASRVLPQYRIAPEKLLKLLQALRITRLNDWLGLTETQFYQKLVQSRQLSSWAPEIVPRQDEKGFTEAWRKLRWELINEDPTGLAGFAINMDGISRRGEPLMRKMAQLDERTRRSYARTFLMDLLREEAPMELEIKPTGILINYPNASNASLTIVLMIDESVAIYKDPKDNLHMPVKHAALIEYHG